MAEQVKSILCYGDSNTWGYNPRTGERHDYGYRWTTVAGTMHGPGYRLIPEGLNGRTTVLEDTIEPGRNGLRYLGPCLVSHKPLALAQEYRLVAEELGVPFLDAAAHVECPFPDGIHLDAEGERTLGEVLARWIREELLEGAT